MGLLKRPKHTSTLTVAFTREYGEGIADMVKVCLNGQVEQCTLDTLEMIEGTAKAIYYTLMAQNTKVNGDMTKETEKESLSG